MLHCTDNRSGTIDSIKQITPKLAQIRRSVIPIPGEDGQIKDFHVICNIRSSSSFIQFIVLVKLFKY
jgi:hypothetical protein